MANLSNQPYKGTSDWFPEEFAVRKYIFDTWRSVCTRFGYQEYLTPLVEDADVYRAKSGEDVGGKELMIMRDNADRELAIRPEMTPSVTRMVSRQYEGLPKPIRYFSIANFMRGEKPQRGRNREFWQLNFDIFGSDSINADVEILQMAVEIMLAFSPPEDSFVIYLNNRELIAAFVTKYLGLSEEKIGEATRLLDKFEKLPREEFFAELETLGANISNRAELENIMMREDSGLSSLEKLLAGEPVMQTMFEIVGKLAALGYEKYFKWNPGMVRGFDYYDGMVFEVFDLNPENNRSMFGGGRYNGLGALFGGNSFPAVGCAPGDETTYLFLESWGLLEKIKDERQKTEVFIPILSEELFADVQRLAQQLRAEGKNVEVGLEVQKFGKALEYANKREIPQVAIIGEDEKAKGIYLLKDMQSGEQSEVSLG